MGLTHKHRPVMLILAAFSRHRSALQWAREKAESEWGPIALASELFPFHETDYYTASMGVYVFNRSALEHIPHGAYFDFPDLIQAMAPARSVATHPHDGLWLDIGRHEDFEEAQRLFEAHRDEFLEVWNDERITAVRAYV